ncbi:hypothetical protein Esti_001354 [Eimeria stiedai]
MGLTPAAERRLQQQQPLALVQQQQQQQQAQQQQQQQQRSQQCLPWAAAANQPARIQQQQQVLQRQQKHCSSLLPSIPWMGEARCAGKGGKNRRRGKNDNEGEKRELQFKEAGQEYGQVLRMLGNGRLEAHCFDGVRRLCHIRGKMRKRVWVNAGDIVLISLREFQDNKGDIIAKYTPDEARALKSYGELPANAKINETDAFGDEEGGAGGIDFQDSGSDSGSEEEDAQNDLDIDDCGGGEQLVLAWP